MEGDDILMQNHSGALIVTNKIKQNFGDEVTVRKTQCNKCHNYCWYIQRRSLKSGSIRWLKDGVEFKYSFFPFHCEKKKLNDGIIDIILILSNLLIFLKVNPIY